MEDATDNREIWKVLLGKNIMDCFNKVTKRSNEEFESAILALQRELVSERDRTPATHHYMTVIDGLKELLKRRIND